MGWAWPSNCRACSGYPDPMTSRLAAFLHAARGGLTLLRTQVHARVHLAATVIVIALGVLLRVSLGEWAFLAIAIAMVWASEALNTAIEFLADEVSLERRERIKHAKDIGAFAVLAASSCAALIGCWVFLPKILHRI